MAIFTILVLPFHEHGKPFHLLISFSVLSSVSSNFDHTSLSLAWWELHQDILYLRVLRKGHFLDFFLSQFAICIYKGRHGAGDIAENSNARSEGNRKRVTYLDWLDLLKPQSLSPGTHRLYEGHTFSNKVTYTNSALPMGLLWPFLFKPPQIPLL